MLSLPYLITIIIFGYSAAFIIGYVYYYQKKYGQRTTRSRVTIKELLENVADEKKGQFIEKQQKTMAIITETKKKITDQVQAAVPGADTQKYLGADKAQEMKLIQEGAKLLKQFASAVPVSEEQRKADMDDLLKAASTLDAMEKETPIENVEEHFTNVGYGLWMDTIAQGLRKITSDANIRKSGILQVEKLMSFLPRAFDPKEIRNALQLMKKSKEIIDLVELNPKTIVVAFTPECTELKIAEKVLLAAMASEDEMSKQKVKNLFGWEDNFLNETIAHLQALNIMQVKGDKLVAEGLLTAKDRENIKQKEEARKAIAANPAPQVVEAQEVTPTPVVRAPAVSQIQKMPASLPKPKQAKPGAIPLPPVPAVPAAPAKPSIPAVPKVPAVPAVKPLKPIPTPPAGTFVPKAPATSARPKVAPLPGIKELPAIKSLPQKPTVPATPVKPVAPQTSKLPATKTAPAPAKKASKPAAAKPAARKKLAAAEGEENVPEHYVQIGNATPINDTQRQLDIEDIMGAVAELEKESSFSSGKEKTNMRIFDKEGNPVNQEELLGENRIEEGLGGMGSVDTSADSGNVEQLAEKILAIYEKQEIVNGGVMQMKKLKVLLAEEDADFNDRKLASTLEVVKSMGMISNIIKMAGDDQLILFKNDMELGPDELGIIQLALGTPAAEFTKDNIVQLLNVPEELVLDALKKLQDKGIIRFSGDSIEIPGIIQE